VNGGDIVHTYHECDGPAHVTSGFNCWCGPTVQTVCVECAAHDEAQPDCWLCGGIGWVAVESPAEHDGPLGLSILHRCRHNYYRARAET
jgi:hypothetical protein